VSIHVLQVTRGHIWGGGERHVLSLLEAFHDRDAVRQSLAVFDDGPLAHEARALGVSVHLVARRFRGDLNPLTGLARLVRREHIDVVHTHMLSGNIYGRLAARLGRAGALITTLHYIDPEALPFLPPLLQGLFFHGDIRMAAMCDRIVTTSEDMRRVLVARGMNAGKLVPILNGINPAMTAVPANARARIRDDLGIPPDAVAIGAVGRLVPVKNFSLLLAAARRLRDRGLQARVVIIGDGRLRASLEAEAQALGLDGFVIFAGFRREVTAVLSAMDLGALSSNSETSAYGVSEAMAMGLPVVATAVGGVPELIRHGETGWLCPPRDPEALADGLARFITNPGEARRIGEQARRFVRDELSLARMADRLETVYADALTARARRRVPHTPREQA
jgi:glycosyltransferase involved in cell wall biosynthesis